MNIKSQFTIDLNPGVYADKSTIKQIIYVEYMFSTFPCAIL